MFCLYSHSFGHLLYNELTCFYILLKVGYLQFEQPVEVIFFFKFFKPQFFCFFFFAVNTMLLGSKYKSMYVINQHLEISKKAPFSKWKRLLQ